MSDYSHQSVYEMADRVLGLGVMEAVLCGGSADVQQWLHPLLCKEVQSTMEPMIVASSRSGSSNPGTNRRLNNIFVLTRRGSA